MPSYQPEACSQDQLLAMRDASAGAFEAARVKYFRLLRHMEVASIDYVIGKCDKAQVNALAEHLLVAEFNVSEAARRTRLYQEALDKQMARHARNGKTQSAAPTQKTQERPHPSIKDNRYLELLTFSDR